MEVVANYFILFRWSSGFMVKNLIPSYNKSSNLNAKQGNIYA